MTALDEIVLVYCRELHVCWSWDEALEVMAWASDADEDWIDKIERIRADGTRSVMERSEAFKLAYAESEKRHRNDPPPRAHIANVWIDYDIAESFFAPQSMADAEAYADKLRPFLGDRVKALPPRGRP